jgi:hypothetical protein
MAAALLGTTGAHAQDRAACLGEADMCATLAAGEAELAGMLVSGDVGIVARLFADDAVWTLSDAPAGARQRRSPRSPPPRVWPPAR